MGHRCPIRLIHFALALAACLASALGSQTTPAPANLARAVQAEPSWAADFRKNHLSHLALQRGGRTIHVYLYAEDQKVDLLSATFCGGNQGAKQYSGHFQLLSVADNVVVSRLDLDPDDIFVEKRPHDGARLIHDPKSGQYLIAIYQYGSCSSESVQAFSADPFGRLFLVSFLDRDGRTWKQMLTGPDGAVPQDANGELVFCSYVKDIGYDFCGAYTFDGANFLEADRWMTRELAAPVNGLNDEARAARTVFDFLSALSLKGYSTAAYYLDSNVGSPPSAPAPTNLGQKASFLENYCALEGGQCLTPVKIERKPGADAPGALLFQVSFQTSDFQPFNMGSRSSFDFRVAKTSDGFKVLDLPPRIP